MTESRSARRHEASEPARDEAAAVEPGTGSAAPVTAVPDEVIVKDDKLEAIYEAGLEVKARSQWALARRRFFRHKLAVASLILLFIIFGAGAFAEVVAPYGYAEQRPLEGSLAPTLENQHYFGTDVLGRDYFSRVVFGIRTSARVALLVSLLSTLIGATVGAIAGYFGGWVDNALMRVTDLWLTLPILPVLLVVAALVGTGSAYTVAIILAIFFWTTLARIVRGLFLSLREKEYVEAARAVGASDRRIILRHMLPNSLGPIIVNATLTVAIAILIEATLSFIGYGVQPPTPALGKLIADGQGQMLTLWWLVFFPGVTIVAIVLCINFVGDGLRDALDPTQRRVRA